MKYLVTVFLPFFFASFLVLTPMVDASGGSCSGEITVVIETGTTIDTCICSNGTFCGSSASCCTGTMNCSTSCSMNCSGTSPACAR